MFETKIAFPKPIRSLIYIATMVSFILGCSESYLSPDPENISVTPTKNEEKIELLGPCGDLFTQAQIDSANANNETKSIAFLSGVESAICQDASGKDIAGFKKLVITPTFEKLSIKTSAQNKSSFEYDIHLALEIALEQVEIKSKDIENLAKIFKFSDAKDQVLVKPPDWKGLFIADLPNLLMSYSDEMSTDGRKVTLLFSSLKPKVKSDVLERLKNFDNRQATIRLFAFPNQQSKSLIAFQVDAEKNLDKSNLTTVSVDEFLIESYRRLNSFNTVFSDYDVLTRENVSEMKAIIDNSKRKELIETAGDKLKYFFSNSPQNPWEQLSEDLKTKALTILPYVRSREEGANQVKDFFSDGVTTRRSAEFELVLEIAKIIEKKYPEEVISRQNIFQEAAFAMAISGYDKDLWEERHLLARWRSQVGFDEIRNRSEEDIDLGSMPIQNFNERFELLQNIYEEATKSPIYRISDTTARTGISQIYQDNVSKELEFEIIYGWFVNREIAIHDLKIILNVVTAIQYDNFPYGPAKTFQDFYVSTNNKRGNVEQYEKTISSELETFYVYVLLYRHCRRSQFPIEASRRAERYLDKRPLTVEQKKLANTKILMNPLSVGKPNLNTWDLNEILGNDFNIVLEKL